MALTVAPLMFGLAMGGKEFAWGSWPIFALLGCAIWFGFLFVRIEHKSADPIIAIRLFNHKVVSSAGIGFLSGFVAIAVMTYLPFYVQGVMGSSASHVATMITGMIAALIVGTGIGSHLMPKVSVRAIMIGAATLLLAGVTMLSLIDAETTDLYFHTAMALVGLGTGPLFPTITLLAQSSVGPEHTTSVTSLLSFVRNIGMAIGSSLLAVVVNAQVTRAAERIGAQTDTFAPEQLKMLRDPNVLMDAHLQSLIPEPALLLLKDGLSLGIIQVFVVTVGAVLLLLLFGAFTGNERLAARSGGKKFGLH